jgi:hypothetical protein
MIALLLKVIFTWLLALAVARKDSRQAPTEALGVPGMLNSFGAAGSLFMSFPPGVHVFPVKIQCCPHRTLPDGERTAHHEMEWFFATTEGFPPGTSIMVLKNTDDPRVSSEDLLPRCTPSELANTAKRL